MARKDRRERVPELDPFGANDPAWERYEGVSQIRRLARARASRRASPRERRLSFVAAMLLLVPLIAGAIVVLVQLLID